jgi:hypothetical protein
MYGSPSVVELDREAPALSEAERLRFAEEFLVATSQGWEQVMSLLQHYVRDPESKALLQELRAA